MLSVSSVVGMDGEVVSASDQAQEAGLELGTAVARGNPALVATQQAFSQTRFGEMGACFVSSVVASADGKQDVDMARFFEASNLFLSMLITLKPIFGLAGGKIVDPISVNLKVSQAGFESNPRKRSMLSSYLSPEHIPREDKSVHELKWLLRVLEFFLTMLIDVFEDRATAQAAYERTLGQYHHIIVRKSIKVGLRGMPSRDQIADADDLCLNQANLSKEQRKALVISDVPLEGRRALQVIDLMIKVFKHHSPWD